MPQQMQQIDAHGNLVVTAWRLKLSPAARQHVPEVTLEPETGCDIVVIQRVSSIRAVAKLIPAPSTVVAQRACACRQPDADGSESCTLVLRGVGPVKGLRPVEFRQAPEHFRAWQTHLHRFGVKQTGVCTWTSLLNDFALRPDR